jgi:hypothetical protein
MHKQIVVILKVYIVSLERSSRLKMVAFNFIGGSLKTI